MHPVMWKQSRNRYRGEFSENTLPIDAVVLFVLCSEACGMHILNVHKLSSVCIIRAKREVMRIIRDQPNALVMWWGKWDIEWCLSLHCVSDSGDMACATQMYHL